MKSAIGIDPDSSGFVCALVRGQDTQVIKKGFLATEMDLGKFLRWVKAEGELIVAIEGSNGQSRPIEKAFREAGLVFYSFKPADTENFRKAVLGQNKDNERDAESVARYALALEAQGKLEQYRRVWFADMELQLLTRQQRSLKEQMTAEVNRLWKLIRYASADLYLALGGKNPEVECGQKVVKSQGILTLLIGVPDVGQWKSLSDEQLLEAMGGGNYKGRRQLIQELRKVMGSFQPLSEAMGLLLRTSAQQIQRLREEQVDITRMLEDLTRHSAAVQALRQMKGIATNTAASMIAEIIDVRRFAREDSLACYTGLGMNENSTGRSLKMVPTQMFNHRLKDAFMTAALNVVLNNPDSHLAGYHRNLVKRGMDSMEATKRVARALVRVIYRKLSALVEVSSEVKAEADHKRGESEVASGRSRSDRSHLSNTSLSSPQVTRTRRTKEVKASGPRTAITKVRRKRRVFAKIIA